MKTLSMLVLVKAILALTILTLIFVNIAMANAQQVSSQSIPLQQEGKEFQSISDGFSILVPAGWLVQDVSSTDTSSLLTEMLQSYRILAQLCPQEQALHDNGDKYNCDEAQDLIYVNQYPKLADEPEFASIANGNNNDKIIANEDFLKYQIRKLQEIGYSDIKIVNNTDVPINIINTDTNKTTAKVPANLVEMTYTKNSTETRGYFLLTATNATSNTGIISGYRIFYEADAAKILSASQAERIKQVFQSFEFVKGQGEGESVAADAAKNPANSTGSATQQSAISLPSAFLQY